MAIRPDSPYAIRPDSPYAIRRVALLDSEMAYIETGTGDPIVFLHGNPTSSFLWRNIFPHVEDLGRCVAPDMMGMGQSGQIPGSRYGFADQARYLDAFYDALDLTANVIFVLHDWGGALGYHRIRRFPDQAAGVAYCETMVRPRKWTDLPAERQPIFRKFRTQAGERMVIDDNFFVETMLFEMGIVRDLSDAEKEVYRAPYREPARRWPTLQWPREIPFDGEPADTHAIAEAYAKFLATSDIPKLMINVTGGHALTGEPREFCRTWPNQTEVTLEGRHVIQEDRPDEFGGALRAFVESVRGRG